MKTCNQSIRKEGVTGVVESFVNKASEKFYWTNWKKAFPET